MKLIYFLFKSCMGYKTIFYGTFLFYNKNSFVKWLDFGQIFLIFIVLVLIPKVLNNKLHIINKPLTKSFLIS